ncbi:MAG TPA: isoprenylcysteine carboxylmethyltransferase family protein [Acidimicrobiales bacterium]|nr:isoprenylcysteine carboxylmethyltransferase family protein [Acidimicrobiales bacterium]
MHILDPVIIVVWIAFWIYWLAASAGTKSGRSRWGRFVGFRVAVVIVAVVLVRAKAFKGATVNHDLWLGVVGFVVFLCGLAVAVWARRYLGSNWGMPMSEKDDPELVTSGPYHLIRHPIYSGIILGMVGTAVAITWYWLIAVAVIGGYFIYSAVVEERHMTEVFPDSYPAYKHSSKMLIPFIL